LSADWSAGWPAFRNVILVLLLVSGVALIVPLSPFR
jgi:hypothetical protein